MKYSIEQDQIGKIYQYYPTQLTKWMDKNALEQFIEHFRGFKRADILVKGDGKGKNKCGKSFAIFIRRSNKLRRKEDKDVTMRLSDFLLGQIYCGRKKEGISLLSRWVK